MTEDNIFKGGRVLVIKTAGGYDVEHEPEAGGCYPMDHFRHLYPARRYGMRVASERGAKLFVEELF